jgi:PAS domain S-box-containing protein
LIRLLAWSWFATLVLLVFVSHRVMVQLVTYHALLSACVVIFSGLKSMWIRHPGSQYFGVAWGALYSGVIALALHNYDLIPSNLLTANSLLIGSALEMMLLSFALADRINTSRKETGAALAQVASEQAVVSALQRSQERYQAVIEHVAEGMLVLQNNQFVFVNTRATEILGVAKESILKNGVLRLIQADDQHILRDRYDKKIRGDQLSERCQVRMLTGDDQVKWLEFGESWVPWDGDQGLLIYFLDVTERHVAEHETRAALDRQEELNELRSRFVAMTSHEFRTPLATILAAQDLLKNFNDQLPQVQRLEILEMIRAGVRRMTQMLERVLLLGQAEAGMLDFNPKNLDLQSFFDVLISIAKNQHPDSDCDFETSCPTECIEGLYDEKLLQHIFSNLLSNAIKYSPNGGKVCIGVTTTEFQTVFTVSDQGIGIPIGEIEQLFETFHRASNVGQISGTGLGLAIVKQAVELHGGGIDVDSEIGRGTRFTVRLDILR